MNDNATQLEILLLTGTTFLSRQWYEEEYPDKKSTLSEKEKLEEACWNGFLPEMLPEICGAHNSTKLYIWKIRDAATFLNLEMGQFPQEVQQIFSIDPYYFLHLSSPN